MSNLYNIIDPEARRLAQLAESEGFHIEVKDYGHTVGACLSMGEGEDRRNYAFHIRKEYRPEEDEMNGWARVTEKALGVLMSQAKSYINSP
jgi:hypothetical protein